MDRTRLGVFVLCLAICSARGKPVSIVLGARRAPPHFGLLGVRLGIDGRAKPNDSDSLASPTVPRESLPTAQICRRTRFCDSRVFTLENWRVDSHKLSQHSSRKQSKLREFLFSFRRKLLTCGMPGFDRLLFITGSAPTTRFMSSSGELFEFQLSPVATIFLGVLRSSLIRVGLEPDVCAAWRYFFSTRHG